MKNKNLYIYRESTYTKLVVAKNDDGTSFDLTGHDVHIVISKHFESMPKYVFVITITDAEMGEVTINLTDTDTMTLPTGSLVYSMWATNVLGVKTLLLQGTVFVESTVFEEVA